VADASRLLLYSRPQFLFSFSSQCHSTNVVIHPSSAAAAAVIPQQEKLVRDHFLAQVPELLLHQDGTTFLTLVLDVPDLSLLEEAKVGLGVFKGGGV
jgi:hypothetical protein